MICVLGVCCLAAWSVLTDVLRFSFIICWNNSEFVVPSMMAGCPGQDTAKKGPNHDTTTTMFHIWDKILKLECSVFFSPNTIASQFKPISSLLVSSILSPIVLWLVHVNFSKQFSFWRTMAFLLLLCHSHHGCSVFSWWWAHEHQH